MNRAVSGNVDWESSGVQTLVSLRPVWASPRSVTAIRTVRMGVMSRVSASVTSPTSSPARKVLVPHPAVLSFLFQSVCGCVNLMNVCDGKEDCRDGTDEMTCPGVSPPNITRLLLLQEVTNCPLPCIWATWSPWSSCATTCGPTFRSRSREVLVEAAWGGEPCNTVDKEEKKFCALGKCIVILINFMLLDYHLKQSFRTMSSVHQRAWSRGGYLPKEQVTSIY